MSKGDDAKLGLGFHVSDGFLGFCGDACHRGARPGVGDDLGW